MPVHRFVIPLWIALGLTAGAARAVTVDQIPSPRPTGWTVDLTGTLPAETVAELNRLRLVGDVPGEAGCPSMTSPPVPLSHRPPAQPGEGER